MPRKINSKGKRGEADNVYDPVSLAHMRLNRKEVHCDYNPSHPDVIIHMFGIPAQTPFLLKREEQFVTTKPAMNQYCHLLTSG
jgi:hypothetical protein